MTKKKILSALLIVMAVVAVMYFLIPFVKSMGPTQSAINDSVLNIKINDIKPGSYKYVNWKHAPIVVYKPGIESIQTLISYNDETYGPDITNENISNIYVYEKISTYKGCSLTDIKEHYEAAHLPEGWFDMCHMGSWDFTGRAFIKYFVPLNSRLPNLTAIDYKVINDETIQIQKKY